MSGTELGRRLGGVSHIALNCSDMAKTVEFYEKLGIPLQKTFTIPGADEGQHFFFDVGNNSQLGYIYWNDEMALPSEQGSDMRDGAMNHVAVHIEDDAVQEWWDHLSSTDLTWAFMDHKVDGGVICNDISRLDEETFAASFYVQDPDGATIEFTAWYPAWDRVGNADPATGRTKRADRKTEWVAAPIDYANRFKEIEAGKTLASKV